MTPTTSQLLVVDDNEAGRYVKLHALRRAGYTVREAAGGYAALSECETNLPELVILDTMLPDLGGAEVCQRIKSRWPQTVVLQTSAARGSSRDRVDALDGGADAFLVEPIDPAELVAYVKALLRMRNAEQGERRVNEHLEELVRQRTQDLAEANERLKIEIHEREKTEEMLHHAQKLEALGQLTGGIAHDLNNVLAVIQSGLGMVRASIDGRRNYPPDKLKWIIGSAEAAAGQGAKVIQQMLAFARRGTFASEVVIIDEVVAGCEAYLRRAVTEAVTVQIVNTGDLWPTQIDPVQLEASLLNLAANARDAMPQGGVLRIETANVAIADDPPHPKVLPPGSYVCMRVSDNGIGMDDDVAKRAFEPFFTTKDVGRGTGLGLSQVYGFVIQSGGHISIDSSPGHGSTFTLHFPRCEASPISLPMDIEDDDAPTGNETILVVEDNDGVRDLAVMTIADFGYHVLSAPNGPAALDVLRQSAGVDLLFSDIVMPGGLNGFELARIARDMRNDLKVLVTSGYVNIREDERAPKIPILPKPYSRTELARQLRRALDAA